MTNTMCTFYIVRHGETQWNVQKILQGHKDSPLTEGGIRAAKEIAQMFKGIRFAEIFSSDLFRAQRTAEIIALEHQLAVKTSHLIRERCFGEYEGKPIEVYLHELKGLLEKFEALTEQEQFSSKIKDDIESDEEIITRMLSFLRETAVAYCGQNVLVVAHGGIMRTLLAHLGFASRKELPPNAVRNLGYIKLASDGIEFDIKETHNVYKEKI